MRISGWSSDVCSSDLDQWNGVGFGQPMLERIRMRGGIGAERGMKIGGQEHHAAAPCNSLASPASAWRASNQSAALLAPLAARKIARVSSRSTPTQLPR